MKTQLIKSSLKIVNTILFILLSTFTVKADSTTFILDYKLLSSNGMCKDSLYGTMSLAENRKSDTCWEYYYYLYQSEILNSLSDISWDTMSDAQLLNYYSLNDSNILISDGPANKEIKYKFIEDGHYLLIAKWHNKCLNKDTTIMARLSIELCCTDINTLYITREPKLIGVYDILGRPVNYKRKDEVLFYLYNDGSIEKIIQH